MKNLFKKVTDICVTLASLFLSASLAALCVSLLAVSQACLASALDNWTSVFDSAEFVFFPGSFGWTSHGLLCVRGDSVTTTKHWHYQSHKTKHKMSRLNSFWLNLRESLLTVCSFVMLSDTHWREEVATKILMWSNSKGSSVFNHLHGRILLSPDNLILV